MVRSWSPVVQRLLVGLLAAFAVSAGTTGAATGAGGATSVGDQEIAPPPTVAGFEPPTLDDLDDLGDLDEPAPVIDVTDVPDEGLPLIVGPVVSIPNRQFEVGEAIIVTLAGFESQFLNVAICGNEARRGSGDCNMHASNGVEVDPEEATTRIRMVVAPPPTMCPCVIRAASNAQSEVAVVPIDIFGQGWAQPVDPPVVGPLVEATISVSEADANPLERLRSALGGSTRYDVLVTARNTLTTPLYDLSAAASVGRGDNDDLALIELAPIPDVLAPGQRWQQVVQVDLPRLNIGEAEWRLLVSGAGPPIEAAQTTSNTPTALYVLVALFVLDIVYILYRMGRRKKRARLDQEPDQAGPLIDIDEDGQVRYGDDDIVGAGADVGDAAVDVANDDVTTAGPTSDGRQPDRQPIGV